MATANKSAGELDVVINEKPYLLRPSYAAVLDFEDRANTTVFEAMRAVGERQSASLKSVATVFHACIKAGWTPRDGKTPTFDEIVAAVYKDGLSAHMQAYLTILSNMLTGERAMGAAMKEVEQGKAE